MIEQEILYKLKRKENKTLEDQMLLDYYKALVDINCYLVSESKEEITTECALEKIREINCKAFNKKYTN